MDDYRFTTYTPLLRRFTDERSRDLGDLHALYSRVRALHDNSQWSKGDAGYPLGGAIYGACEPPDGVLGSYIAPTIHRLLVGERHIFSFPAVDLGQLNIKEQSDLKHFLRMKEKFHHEEERHCELIYETLANIFAYVVQRLPQFEEPSPFTIPLIHTLYDPKRALSDIIASFYREPLIDAGLFVELTRTVHFNMCRVSGIADPWRATKPLKMPVDYEGSLEEMVDDYLRGTPLQDFLLAPVPLKFTREERLSHMHVVGGSGAGKTQLLQSIILHDLESDDPPSLVIIDSQTDLIRKLSHLECFVPDGRLGDRLTLITPRDVKNPPALNIFDLNRDRLNAYDEATKEQVVAGVIQTFSYVFDGLVGADLTAKQSVFFRFVARLMLAIPETMGRSATILDMLSLMDDPTPYLDAIKRLPPIQRQFFERDFLDKKNATFKQTREQIRYRLNAILENPTFARLFTAPSTKIDLFETLNSGGIVLVDTADDFLKDASPHFGRVFISLVLQAIMERAALPEAQRRPTFLIVDEAASYFDSNIDDLLTAARKFRCGCLFAHQYLEQASWQLRSSLAANTAIKFASGVSVNDARQLAPDMRTNAEFILSQGKLHFAAYIRHTTANAVSVPVEAGRLEREPTMDEIVYRRMRRTNAENVSIPVNGGGEFTSFPNPAGQQGDTEGLTGHEFRPQFAAPSKRDTPRYAAPESSSTSKPSQTKGEEDGTATSNDW